MTGTRQACRRGIARLLTLCAVLLGLFLMHGAPANAAEGCHGQMTATAAVHEAPAVAATTAMTHSGDQQAADTPAAHGGALCVSTPARDETPLPAGALTAIIGVLAVGYLAFRPWLGGTGRRGPPPPGRRSLLLQVCIART
ncbi:hypothetical protein OG304_04445 [Streptomyces sp. NBC_00160]|uniref:hypothetical protein n=1 Tax=Streptomyces sp. NBC_00160 TaxID=2903628 RepID=UPI0022563CAB|nr:hypothetical protein [Streptomyces sp. NBC_00160]MCX5302703.1 hypothetical protein [Streptomyces sp. NBC_00160]